MTKMKAMPKTIVEKIISKLVAKFPLSEFSIYQEATQRLALAANKGRE